MRCDYCRTSTANVGAMEPCGNVDCPFGVKYMPSYLQRELEGRVHIPDVSRSLSFADIIHASNMNGNNTVAPKIGDLIILADSCNMGVSIREQGRVRCTGKAFDQRLRYGSKADSIMLVPTNGPRPRTRPEWEHTVLLADLRPLAKHRNTWIYIQ